jgi:hypothetical protein
MDPDPFSLPLSQPVLFNLIDTTTGEVELFPSVWGAAEEFISPEVSMRRKGLDTLRQIGASRLSPLIAYLIATRLIDSDLELRKLIILTLSEVLEPDREGKLAPDGVLRTLTAYLTQMRTRIIYMLLEAAASDPLLQPHVARILNCSPFAGNHLAALLQDRKTELAIRREAARMIGLVGYLEVIPMLEKMETRLSARTGGQQEMPFAPPSSPEETQLLPLIVESLRLLKST